MSIRSARPRSRKPSISIRPLISQWLEAMPSRRPSSHAMNSRADRHEARQPCGRDFPWHVVFREDRARDLLHARARAAGLLARDEPGEYLVIDLPPQHADRPCARAAAMAAGRECAWREWHRGLGSRSRSPSPKDRWAASRPAAWDLAAQPFAPFPSSDPRPLPRKDTCAPAARMACARLPAGDHHQALEPARCHRRRIARAQRARVDQLARPAQLLEIMRRLPDPPLRRR